MATRTAGRGCNEPGDQATEVDEVDPGKDMAIGVVFYADTNPDDDNEVIRARVDELDRGEGHGAEDGRSSEARADAGRQEPGVAWGR